MTSFITSKNLQPYYYLSGCFYLLVRKEQLAFVFVEILELYSQEWTNTSMKKMGFLYATSSEKCFGQLVC